MKAMDNFYQQNPPQENIRLKNILQEFEKNYLKLNQENIPPKRTDWTLWIIIGGVWIVLVAGIIFTLSLRRRKSNKSEE